MDTSRENSPNDLPLSRKTRSISDGSPTAEILTTPSPKSSSGGSSFCTDEEDFAHHRFYGPSTDYLDSRVLHGFRDVDVLSVNPKFRSEPVHLGPISSTLVSMEHIDGNPFEVNFTEDKLGFGIELKVTENNQIKVHVAYVDHDSPAKRAGVVLGDYLLSVNGRRLDANVSKEEVLELIQGAENPRTMLFMRFGDKGGSPKTTKVTKNKFGVISRLRNAKNYVGSLGRKSLAIHRDCSCDGCGVSPIKGSRWSCSVCVEFNLCDTCYQNGAHGMEKSESMQLLSEAKVQEKIKRKCKTLTPEFLTSLRRDICKGRIDKFEYMGNWLADIVGGTAAAKIAVRGIEVPHLTPESRQRFVAMLMPLASNRTDIEVNIEWIPQPVASDEPDGSADESNEVTGEKELLRIWISDKKTRTKSPFSV